MTELRKLANGHAKPNGKCPVDELLEAHARVAEEVIEAVTIRRQQREKRSGEAS